MTKPLVLKLSEVGIEDVEEVGGKNASLGEMIQDLTKKGVRIPGGFIVTATAYRHFLKSQNLDIYIKEALNGLDTHDLEDLERRGKLIRDKIVKTDFPQDLTDEIIKFYKEAKKEYGDSSTFACRSSATAEDLPGASFAGEHETYLNVSGEENILLAVKKAMASLFNDRAISYRVDKGFDHFKVALSVGVQKMIRSDKSSSGIMFTLDTETGFPNIIIINSTLGLGEMIVQGSVTPDEYLVFKKTLDDDALNPIIFKKLGHKDRKMIYSDNPHVPTKIIDTTETEMSNFAITDKEVKILAKWGEEIEKHYSAKYKKWTPMDIEWAKDGVEEKLYIVQARPETIHSERDLNKIKVFERTEKGEEIAKGSSVGNKIAVGKARIILDTKHIGHFQKGEILVTEITDPDWEPIMKIASGIITDKGGRTSHAAIVSRELGIPCIVGTKDATKKIKDGDTVTIDTTGSEGLVFKGELKFKVTDLDIKDLPETKTHIMMNIATPETAFEKSFLPNKGVGLAREEFIIASNIGIHPMALINYSKLDDSLKHKIDKLTGEYKDKPQFYVDKLAEGIAKIAVAFHPNDVILRLSDFKTNEYRSLIGGDLYEPQEENPMIGWRGASRYYHPEFEAGFELEVKAIKKVREEFGLKNLVVMVPFCRTPEEGQKVIDTMKKFGLSREKDKGLKIYVMCEIPSNVLLADEFLDVFDGMSIGSNDLTQLILGIDRDGNFRIRSIANENSEAVKKMVAQIIKTCRAKGKYIGICGQAPSDYPDFAAFLVKAGIESISLNPDSIISTIPRIAKEEKSL